MKISTHYALAQSIKAKKKPSKKKTQKKATAQYEPKWHSIKKDGYPKILGWYLVYIPFDDINDNGDVSNIFVANFCGTDNYDIWTDDSSESLSNKWETQPTHWAKMPSPPPVVICKSCGSKV